MKRAVPQVVLDTNVVVSALIFGRIPMQSLRLGWQSTLFAPLVSAATAAELVRVLAYPKFRLTAEDREQLLADYLPYCTIVDDAGATRLPHCRDPLDVPFLRLAIAGRARYLVSGDRDLLAMPDSLRFRILTPAEFASTLRLPV